MRQFFLAPIKLLIWSIIKMALAVQYLIHQLKIKLLHFHSKRRGGSSHPYHCVEIELVDHEDDPLNSEAKKNIEVKVCSYALKQRGILYLSNNAPHLPLPKCDSINCTCHYKHHDDRRSANRRSYDKVHHQLYWHNDFNHRKANDRRKSAKA